MSNNVFTIQSIEDNELLEKDYEKCEGKEGVDKLYHFLYKEFEHKSIINVLINLIIVYLRH